MKIELQHKSRDLLIYRDGVLLYKVWWEDVGWGGMLEIENILGTLFPNLTWLPEVDR